jgi:hypothetical protein
MRRATPIGADQVTKSPAYIRDDLSKWTRIVKDANVKVD